ncbi:MAG TPA: hypothetical protein VGB05_05465 [Pyrinomonadaceae bacterium]
MKNGIRVIKREERERPEQQSTQTPDTDAEADPGMDRAKERELTSSMTGWVNDFLKRRDDEFQEDVGELRALLDSKT